MTEPFDAPQEPSLVAEQGTDGPLAMTLHAIALGPIIVLAAATANHLVKEWFGGSGREGRSR